MTHCVRHYHFLLCHSVQRFREEEGKSKLNIPLYLLERGGLGVETSVGGLSYRVDLYIYCIKE
jgi:hypothetical protein